MNSHYSDKSKQNVILNKIEAKKGIQIIPEPNAECNHLINVNTIRKCAYSCGDMFRNVAKPNRKEHTTKYLLFALKTPKCPC